MRQKRSIPTADEFTLGSGIAATQEGPLAGSVGVLVDHQHVASIENHRDGNADVLPEPNDFRVVFDGCPDVVSLCQRTVDLPLDRRVGPVVVVAAHVQAGDGNG